MREVRVIPASREFSTGQHTGFSTSKRRVAGYARVSTDKDAQFSSYEAQIDYYTTLIKGKSEWEFVGIYTDAGISGTSTSRRDGFKKMIADALSGKIDLIVTKSVSRFARNTVDSLSTIRQLKEHKVEVYFEKESIWTFDSKGELLITIMSSLAQEESRSISENVKWGRRKRFADGQVTVPFTRFLGYDKGPNNNLIVNPDQAKIVRYMYTLFLQGITVHAIARQLESDGYKTVTGKNVWHTSSIKYILSNEKYKGDALLQKYYIADFLTKKPVVNNGEVSQYYVQSNHEAIISREVFDLVQQEIKHRKTHVETTKSSSIFSGRIHCGICGGMYGSKVWHSADRYRKVIWQCNDKYKNKEETCTSPHFSEDEFKKSFVRALNKLISTREEIMNDFSKIKDVLLDTTAHETDLEQLKEARNEIVNLMEKLTKENALVAMDQEMYKTQFEGLSQRYHNANEQITALDEVIQDKQYRKAKTELFLKTLKKQDGLIHEFSDNLWYATSDHAVVYSKDTILFTFKNGMEVRG